MEATIKVVQKDLFYNYLTWLYPVIPLKEIDRRVLGAFMTLHHKYKDYDEKELNDILFSDPIKLDISARLNLSESKFNKALRNLQEKGLIQDNKINPVLTKYPKDNKFKINITFKVGT